jgi:GNAT superfamily N-acetyltransferase
MNNYFLIKATKADLPTIHDMAQVTFRHTYREMLSPDQIDYMMEWMYALPSLEKQLNDGHVYYIAMLGDEPCGYVSVQYEGDTSDGKAQFHLHKIYIMPAHQGKGLGRILFNQVLDFAKNTASCKPITIELNMNRDNPALHFYQHLGLKILRSGDFHIGNGYYMNDYILGYSED